MIALILEHGGYVLSRDAASDQKYGSQYPQTHRRTFLSWAVRESIQFALGTKLEGIVRESRCCRDTFAQLGVPGNHLRLGSPALQDCHGPIIQGSKINVTI